MAIDQMTLDFITQHVKSAHLAPLYLPGTGAFSLGHGVGPKIQSW